MKKNKNEKNSKEQNVLSELIFFASCHGLPMLFLFFSTPNRELKKNEMSFKRNLQKTEKTVRLSSCLLTFREMGKIGRVNNFYLIPAFLHKKVQNVNGQILNITKIQYFIFLGESCKKSQILNTKNRTKFKI